MFKMGGKNTIFCKVHQFFKVLNAKSKGATIPFPLEMKKR